jgi:hypothetical protein
MSRYLKHAGRDRKQGGRSARWIGMAYVAKAKPDGYTLLLATLVDRDPARSGQGDRTPPLYPRQFVRSRGSPPTRRCSRCAPRARVKTLQEFIDDASCGPQRSRRFRPGNYGTMNADEMFAQNAGIKLCTCRYTGGGPAVYALLSGSVELHLVRPGDGDSARQGRHAACARMWGDNARVFSLRSDADRVGYPDVFFPVVAYMPWSTTSRT